MFVVKKLITPFVLPPGIIMVVLTLAGLWLLRGRNRRAAFTCLSAAGLLWLVSNGFVANWAMGRLESDLSVPTKVDADVIIMLGAGINSKAPDFSGKGTPGPITMERLVTAARLHLRLGLPIIVSGGKVFKQGNAVALVSRRFLVDLGVAPHKIHVEHDSRDTMENARFSVSMCRQLGYTRPALVTSGFHMKRALLAFGKAGQQVVPYPCGLTTWPRKRLTPWHAMPTAKALRTISIAMHERLGIIYYGWRY